MEVVLIRGVVPPGDAGSTWRAGGYMEGGKKVKQCAK